MNVKHKDSIMEGINIIGMLPGLNANSEKDGILLIGAHYDTVEESNGVNDNGSGMAALLEIVRLISAHSCKFANTILFVAFDLEEYVIFLIFNYKIFSILKEKNITIIMCLKYREDSEAVTLLMNISFHTNYPRIRVIFKEHLF